MAPGGMIPKRGRTGWEEVTPDDFVVFVPEKSVYEQLAAIEPEPLTRLKRDNVPPEPKRRASRRFRDTGRGRR